MAITAERKTELIEEYRQSDGDTAYEAFAASLGGLVTEVDLPAGFERAWDHHHAVLSAWLARTFEREMAEHASLLSATIRGRIEAGIGLPATEYLAALEAAEALADEFDALAVDYDAVITPAAPGAAPEGLDSTGNAAFNALWTLLGTPAFSLPLLEGSRGMPLGVQVVSRRLGDAGLVRAARWLVEREVPPI